MSANDTMLNEDEVGRPLNYDEYLRLPSREGKRIDWLEAVRTKQADECDGVRKEQAREKMNEIIGTAGYSRFKKVDSRFRWTSRETAVDGKMDLEEFQLFANQFHVPADWAVAYFDFLDRNKEGRIDIIEFLKHFGPIIKGHGSYPSLPGKRNYVFGGSLRKLG